MDRRHRYGHPPAFVTVTPIPGYKGFPEAILKGVKGATLTTCIDNGGVPHSGMEVSKDCTVVCLSIAYIVHALEGS